MRPARTRRALACAVALGSVLVTSTHIVSAAAAPPAVVTSGSVEQQVEQLRAAVDRVGRELEQGAVAYEQAEAELALLTQQQFAARADREELLDASDVALSALHGLARAAYKGGVPPMVTALMTGDPGALSHLAYVQRSVNRLGASRTDATRALVEQQAGAAAALERSDGLRRQALSQRQALEVQRLALAERTTELTAELSRAGARLVRFRATEELAELETLALASREAVERAAQLTSTTAGGSCLPPGDRTEANGFLSSASLCPLETSAGHRLRTDAAYALDALSRFRLADVGSPLCVTDSYRDFPSQVDVFRRKPTLAATPGRSQHGWGLAVDLCGGVQGFGSEAHRWMQANAPSFGWVHPPWARQGGSKPEAWHWEYTGTGSSAAADG